MPLVFVVGGVGEGADDQGRLFDKVWPEASWYASCVLRSGCVGENGAASFVCIGGGCVWEESVVYMLQN